MLYIVSYLNLVIAMQRTFIGFAEQGRVYSMESNNMIKESLFIPGKPFAPRDPVQPVAPDAPVLPGKPRGPGKPVSPCRPVLPVPPGDPVEPDPTRYISSIHIRAIHCVTDQWLSTCFCRTRCLSFLSKTIQPKRVILST